MSKPVVIKTCGQALEIVKSIQKLIPKGEREGRTLVVTQEEFDLIKELNGIPSNHSNSQAPKAQEKD